MSSATALAYQLLASTGLPRRVHRRCFGDRLTLVMYHAVVPEPLPLYNWCFVTEAAFRRQMEYLKAQFEIVPLADAPSLLARATRERPLAAVTFDDGYRNNFTRAFPVLRDLGIPATIYLATDFLDVDHPMWDAALYLAFAETDANVLSWDGREFPLGNARQRAAAYARVRDAIKAQSHPEVLSDVRALRGQLGCPEEPIVPLDSPFRMLRSAEVREMASSGLIAFGGHTCSHCILSRQPREVARREIEDSLARVADATGRACADFAYPNGRTEDYDEACLHVLEEKGVLRAVTTVEGPNDVKTPPLSLNRYGMGGNLTDAGFQLKVHHVPAWLRCRTAAS